MDRSPSSPRRGGVQGQVRLQRLLADAGVASRRACEELIEEGRVAVNGRTVTQLPVFVDPEADRITVDGRPVAKPERRLYVMLNKPARVLSVAADEPGADRRTVTDLVDHPAAKRLFPVGRLDYDATGLVLLTNDGELANRLTHPRYEIPKVYEVLVRGDITEDALPRITRDIAKAERQAARLEGRVRPASAGAGLELRILRRDAGKTLLEITLRHGRVPQIEQSLLAAGLPPKKVERTGLGPLRLTGLGVGRWRELERSEIHALRAAVRPGATSRANAPDRPGQRKNAGPRQETGPRQRGQRPTAKSRTPGPSRSPGPRSRAAPSRPAKRGPRRRPAP